MNGCSRQANRHSKSDTHTYALASDITAYMTEKLFPTRGCNTGVQQAGVLCSPIDDRSGSVVK